MQCYLHVCSPGENICPPLWVIALPAVPLHPLSIFVVPTCPDQVLHIEIIGSYGIVALLTSWQSIGLHLPSNQVGIGEIKGDHICLVIFIGGRRAITLIKNPVRMDRLPVPQITMCFLVKKNASVTEKGDIVAEEDVLVASTKSRNLIRISSPHKVIVLGDRSGILYMIVEVMQEVDIGSRINKRTLP